MSKKYFRRISQGIFLILFLFLFILIIPWLTGNGGDRGIPGKAVTRVPP